MHNCVMMGCKRKATASSDFCALHHPPQLSDEQAKERAEETNDLLKRYPEHYRYVGDMEQIDIHAIHHIFGINDPSGCIHQASKTLLILDTSGRQTYEQVLLARDTLNRWLELNGPNSNT